MWILSFLLNGVDAAVVVVVVAIDDTDVVVVAVDDPVVACTWFWLQYNFQQQLIHYFHCDVDNCIVEWNDDADQIHHRWVISISFSVRLSPLEFSLQYFGDYCNYYYHSVS
jgi:hypothetical protein